MKKQTNENIACELMQSKSNHSSHKSFPIEAYINSYDAGPLMWIIKNQSLAADVPQVNKLGSNGALE